MAEYKVNGIVKCEVKVNLMVDVNLTWDDTSPGELSDHLRTHIAERANGAMRAIPNPCRIEDIESIEILDDDGLTIKSVGSVDLDLGIVGNKL